ncbi:branched-chain amino acid transport system II carrier protein [Psychrobacillus sp. FSL K6-2684]|uniref:branched-chain amino acid transport system II carrier protein n=1 Tax=unclassified Psychrobacillus TaxID=2636677 RepID=UPI0011A95E43|nr:branched-chain amino acid transport system II carrier protein [Psychrobacillus sp. AK 1817]QEY20632.1 branched-chain amino acid transport system II carrier protein [Psychrobacillus sp. AK 1817]
MEKKLSFFQIVAIGFMLFAMFLGAGNVIFAPVLGQQAGTNTPIAMAGFLVTGVGLVLLAIIALTKGGGTVEKLASRVSPKFAIVFSVLLFLTLGPIYVIPRTTSVVYEIAIKQLIADSSQIGLFLLIFSIIFIALTVYLSWETTKFVDRLGKLITPVFATLLVIIVAKSIFTPMGSVYGPIEGKGYETASDAFLKGFTQGYFTMDVLAAFVFGGIFIKSIDALGIRSKKEVSKVFIKAGLITVVGLVLLQVSMSWIGATSVDAVGYTTNGGELIALASKALFGQIGIYLIGIVIFLTGITTNVACLAAVAEYFERIIPKVSYKKWLIIFSLGSLIITNFGLTKILTMASPILMLLYPIAIALIILIFTDSWFKGSRSVYVGTIIGVGMVAITDALKEANIAVEALNNVFGFIPLFTSGAGWIVTGLIGAVIGYFFKKEKEEETGELQEV